MSAETKKTQTKNNKNEPKEQRKAKNVRAPANNNLPVEHKSEPEKAPEKPASIEPGPEFYKNLKRETDDILKITEESNARYSKKVIQSNWQKYEAPIESYEEREEVENMGADFEQLVNAPISSGGHFQFKHEKSWNTATTSSQYDKYFEISMANLANSILTIPFYERNDLDIKLFSESDLVSMNHRTEKFKQLYKNVDSKVQTSNNYKDQTDILTAKLKECLMTPKVENINIGDYEDKFIEEIHSTISSDDSVEKTKDRKESINVINNPEDVNKIEGEKLTKHSQIISNKTKKVNDLSGDQIHEEEDLEEWLDDFLSK